MAPERLLGLLPSASRFFGKELAALVKAVGLTHIIHEFICEFSIVRALKAGSACAEACLQRVCCDGCISCIFSQCLSAAALSPQAYGPSMMPTLNKSGDIVLVEKVSVWRGKIEVGAPKRHAL